MILYEYLTDVPLYDGGASIGSDSRYQTERYKIFTLSLYCTNSTFNWFHPHKLVPIKISGLNVAYVLLRDFSYLSLHTICGKHVM